MFEQWAPVTVGWMSRAKAQEEWERFTWKWIWANTVVQSAPIRTGPPKDGEVNKMWHADIAGLNVSHLTLLDFILDTSPPLRQSHLTHSLTHTVIFFCCFFLIFLQQIKLSVVTRGEEEALTVEPLLSLSLLRSDLCQGPCHTHKLI